MPSDRGLEWGAKAAHEEFATSGKALNRPLPKSKKREPSLYDSRLEGESTKDAKRRFRDISKRNINVLLEWRPASAEDIGVNERWLRGLKKKGLSYVSSASKENLTMLANFFGLPSYLHLWQDDLLDSMGLPGPTEQQINTWRHSIHWKHVGKFLDLLDVGKYDHVINLINDLYELEISRVSREFDNVNKEMSGQIRIKSRKGKRK